MDQLIEQLLANIDSEEIKAFPCYYGPDDIQFRLGLNSSGPIMKFENDNATGYYLYFRNEQEDEKYTYQVIKGGELFNKCQSIYRRIRVLCNNPTYTIARDEDTGVMYRNLINIITPILSKAKL
jgi:hypothetical protein